MKGWTRTKAPAPEGMAWWVRDNEVRLGSADDPDLTLGITRFFGGFWGAGYKTPLWPCVDILDNLDFVNDAVRFCDAMEDARACSSWYVVNSVMTPRQFASLWGD